MLASTILRLTLSVVALSTLIIADPNAILTINSVNVTTHENDYYGTWEIEIIKTKKSSQLSAKLPVKNTLPESITMKMKILMNGEIPVEYESTLCDALGSQIHRNEVAESFVKAGLPKDTFPTKCPIIPGDWVISKWDAPAGLIPIGVPDGPISATLWIVEEGKDEAIVELQLEADLSHKYF